MQTKRRITKPKTSREWVEYFKTNRENLLRIPWDNRDALTEAERSAVSDSLRIFQLGETSEGKRLRSLVARHAAQICDPMFTQTMDLFIQEEQRHAHDLARFLSQQSIPLRKFHWTDLLFRVLRRFWNFEACLSVLLTAELVAKSYYRALRKATTSTVLQQICTQLLKDEVQHLYFHSQNLASLQSKRSGLSAALWERCYACFYSATLLAVWIGHKKVFQAAGVTFHDFWLQSQRNKDSAVQDIRKMRFRNHRKSSGFELRRTRLQFQTTDSMQFLDITDCVVAAVRKAKIKNGIVNIQTEHTTTGLMINENEPLLLQDIQRILNRIAPEEENYLHNDFSIRTVNMQPSEEKNGHAHCRALFLRTAESIHIVDGALAMGRWQRLFLIECDRPRLRTIQILILGSA